MRVGAFSLIMVRRSTGVHLWIKHMPVLHVKHGVKCGIVEVLTRLKQYNRQSARRVHLKYLKASFKCKSCATFKSNETLDLPADIICLQETKFNRTDMKDIHEFTSLQGWYEMITSFAIASCLSCI